MKKVATIILNRNLPEITDQLSEHLRRYDSAETDVFVVEAGSDYDKLSKSTTWHANSPEVNEHGLRYSRGMNYGLVKLLEEGRFYSYDYFFLLTNDTELAPEPTVSPLLKVMSRHPKLGILSPCSTRWGERFLFNNQDVKYFWFIHNNAYFLRRDFIEEIAQFNTPTELDFLFDGSNFRGYCSEMELIAKAYANEWGAAITTSVWATENESHLLTKADLIKTEKFETNLQLYVDEGRAWMKRKYGFNSRWSMQMYSKFFYDRFFEFHPELEDFRI